MHHMAYLSGNPVVQGIIDGTVQRLPAEVRVFVTNSCVFMAVGASHGYGQSMPFRMLRPAVGYGEYPDPEKTWLVVLGEGHLVTSSDEDAASLVAHEIAHTFLGLDVTHRQVAEQVWDWGFRGSRSHPDNYGPEVTTAD